MTNVTPSGPSAGKRIQARARSAPRLGGRSGLVEIKQIEKDFEHYVEAMHRSGLKYTFGLVRAMVRAVLEKGE